MEYADPKNRLLHRPGLEMRFARKTRPRIDKPQRKSANVPWTSREEVPAKGREIATTYWERLDQKLQWVLEGGPAYWQEPPNPQRLRLFVRSLDELRAQVELEGLTPH